MPHQTAAFRKIRVMTLSSRVLTLTGQMETLSEAKGGAATNHLKVAQS